MKPASDVTEPTAHSPLRLCNLSLAQLLITMALVPSASSLSDERERESSPGSHSCGFGLGLLAASAVTVSSVRVFYGSTSLTCFTKAI